MNRSDPATPRPTILVVEDEEHVRQMVAAVLRQHGFDAVLCADGQDALERMESIDRLDAMIADIRMPRMGGMELVSRLRADRRWASLPIIAMSAYNDELQEREIRAAGADDFLPKPFTVADLVGTLERLLRASQSNT